MTGRRILIVDDEPFLVRILTHLLAKQGYEIRVAEDGEAALRTAREFRPDLVFLDVMMPLLDGYAVCRAIRSDPDLAAIHVILLSARGQANDREAGLAAGADEYVTKPFATAELIARVQAVLAGRRAA